MMSTFLLVLRSSLLSDLFKSGTDLANLGVLGFLGVSVIILGWLHYRSDQREERRGDALLKLSQDATDQFQRALDVIEKMQNRKRNGDLG